MKLKFKIKSTIEENKENYYDKNSIKIHLFSIFLILISFITVKNFSFLLFIFLAPILVYLDYEFGNLSIYDFWQSFIVWIYPILFLRGLANSEGERKKIVGIKSSLLIIFLLIIGSIDFFRAILVGSNAEKSSIEIVHHYTYWIVFGVLVLPIYQLLKLFDIHLRFYQVVIAFFIIYACIGFCQYQNSKGANELEKEKYFNRSILYTNYRPSGR